VPSPLDALTALVVNWETPDYTMRCVEALIADGVPPGRIVVVDNGSSQESFADLSSRLRGCIVRRLEQNVGYGRAANFAADQLPGDAYLFVDNDAFVHRPGSIAALVAALDDPAVGVSTPLVLGEDLVLQPTVAPAIRTPAVALVQASGLSRTIPNRWQPRWSTHWDHAESREIHGAAGPVLLVRGATWQTLGGFEHRVYFYTDDLDLCWRARRAGWKIWFCAEAVFTHVRAGSTGTRWTAPHRAEMIGRSEAAMLRRHLPRLSAWASIGAISVGLAARWLAFRVLSRREAAASARRWLRGLVRGAFLDADQPRRF
jgi:N-acetylglucosaminyl-diphospho-decaprenol L-rhamnosyltransferase